MRFKKSGSLGVGTIFTCLFKIYNIPGLVGNYYIWEDWLGLMDTTWLLVFLGWSPLFIATLVVLFLFRQERRATKANLDMPIKDVFVHLLSTGAYASYTTPRRAEMQAFCDIHRLACEGKIRVSGKVHSWIAPKQLTIKQLRESKPWEMVVPLSPEAPQGRVFVLGPIDPDTTWEQSTEGVYWGLRVDSRDIYKLWPKGGEE